MARYKASNSLGNRARNGRIDRRENGRGRGGEEAGKRRERRNTARVFGASGPGRVGRQPLGFSSLKVSSTRPLSGCLELLGRVALGVAPLAIPRRRRRSWQRRSIETQCESLNRIAGQRRQWRVRAGAGAACGASWGWPLAVGMEAGRRGEARRQGEAVLAWLAQRQRGRQCFLGVGTAVGMRRGSQAIDRQGEGQVGGRGPGGNSSSTQSAARLYCLPGEAPGAGRQGLSQQRGKQFPHVGGPGRARAWAGVWGKRFSYPISRPRRRGVIAFTPWPPLASATRRC